MVGVPPKKISEPFMNVNTRQSEVLIQIQKMIDRYCVARLAAHRIYGA